MAVIKVNEKDIKTLARLMRAEAEGEGEQGMMMVGNVGVNRVFVKCSDFKDINTIDQMVFQSPGGFEATQKGYFYQRARESEIRLARQAINGERVNPASLALGFCKPAGPGPDTWYDQANAGRYKNHCFYYPTYDYC